MVTISYSNNPQCCVVFCYKISNYVPKVDEEGSDFPVVPVEIVVDRLYIGICIGLFLNIKNLNNKEVIKLIVYDRLYFIIKKKLKVVRLAD